MLMNKIQKRQNEIEVYWSTLDELYMMTIHRYNRKRTSQNRKNDADLVTTKIMS